MYRPRAQIHKSTLNGIVIVQNFDLETKNIFMVETLRRFQMLGDLFNFIVGKIGHCVRMSVRVLKSGRERTSCLVLLFNHRQGTNHILRILSFEGGSGTYRWSSVYRTLPERSSNNTSAKDLTGRNWGYLLSI